MPSSVTSPCTDRLAFMGAVAGSVRAASFAHDFRCGSDGTNDVVVAGATAYVAAEPLTNFFFVWIRITRDQIDRAHDHSGRAITALQAVLSPKSFLKGMQIAALTDAFNRGDGFS